LQLADATHDLLTYRIVSARLVVSNWLQLIMQYC